MFQLRTFIICHISGWSVYKRVRSYVVQVGRKNKTFHSAASEAQYDPTRTSIAVIASYISPYYGRNRHRKRNRWETHHIRFDVANSRISLRVTTDNSTGITE